MVEISRRALLGGSLLVAGIAAGAGLGVTGAVHHKVAVPPAEPPAALTEALGRQQRLLAAYGSASTAVLAGLRADVAAHGDALRALLELYPGWRLGHGPADPSATHPPSAAAVPSESAGPPAPSGAGDPATLCTQDAQFLRQAVLGWRADEPHAGQVLPVLASIAACLSTQAQVLA